jgi:hypothetical protein
MTYDDDDDGEDVSIVNGRFIEYTDTALQTILVLI